MFRGRWRRLAWAAGLLASAAAVFLGQGRVRLYYAVQAARASLAAGRPPAEAIERLTPFEHEQPEAAYLLAVANRRAGRTARARACLARAETLGWWADDLRLQEAMISFQSGDVAQSEAYLLHVVTQGCSDVTALDIYDCLVKGYLSDMRLREASFCLDYWVTWRPRDVEPRLLRAEIYETMRDSKRQMVEYEAILDIDPANVDVRMKLAHLLMASNDPRAALMHLERCRALAPDNLPLLVALGGCHRQLGRAAEAREALQRGLGGDLGERQRAYALSQLGQLALAERAHDEAVKRLEEGLLLSPYDDAMHYALGIAYSRLGKKDQAQKHLDKSQELRKSGTRYAETVRSIARSPDDAGLRRYAGEILLEQGDRQQGFLWLVSALRCDRTSAATHQALARYYADGGEKELAERHRSWAKEFEGSPPIEVSARQ